ncbi:UNVERIFIED_CONTAM: hypothetical protein GTU68_065320 [Idotea baltica]|nr:hypothetical protein [Idotea baltica]
MISTAENIVKTDSSDTIVAIATPSGRGGVGIIRVSGSKVVDIAQQILGSLPQAHKASHRLFLDNQQQTLDDGVALFFPAPNSFTGEDVLELQGHGGQVVMDMLMQRCLQLGARVAKPGEFSERAFLNDKLDLTQAEAIADLIDSGSEQAARSALRSLQGDFSKLIESLLIKMIEMRVYVEAALDFPEEEIDFLADESVMLRMNAIKDQLAEITANATQGSLLRNGLNLVIIGEPNAGKSSLLNVLSGNESAIVTDIAGTTRDVLHESINLDGMPLHLVDTAGLRDSDDVVEKIGIERAWQAIERADIALLLLGESHTVTNSEEIVNKLPESLPLLVVQNKIDLAKEEAGKRDDKIYISAKHNLGIDVLKEELKQRMGYQNNGEDIFIARRRHLRALENTKQLVDNAEVQLVEFNAGELMAEELRLAQDELGQITGKFTSDDLLGEIFSSFCLGK